ncbi:hypothetical protein H6G13_26535 [Pseudanabaena sp. FACHB-2040]|nr:hypothetical protein [Pseudanabaena sp. FACHB-2040]
MVLTRSKSIDTPQTKPYPNNQLPNDQVERRREDWNEAKTFKSPLQRLVSWRLETSNRS